MIATSGMCATSHPLAAQIAVETLKAGGNAMDAAISGAVVLGICEPQMTGIGGDCFVLWSDPAGQLHALNGSGRAPSGASAEALRTQGHTHVPPQSVHAVTVPGAVDAFCNLAERVGRLGIDRLLAPAIHYAEEGVPVAARVAFDWEKDARTLQGRARDIYANAGTALKTGDIFAAPQQAQALREIAKHGRDGFYTGPVAEDMVSSLNAAGGTHSLDDFAATRCTDTTPTKSTYANLTLCEHPPNGQGATAHLILNMLKHFDIASMDPWGADRAHIEAEVTKLAYDARNRFVADPDHTARLEHMLSNETAAALAALVDPKRAMPNPTQLSESVHKETIYITVVDRDRMAVSLIYSIFHGFGSGIASDRYGILFQNRGAGFTLEAGHPNEMGPGKRPMHTIIPGFLTEAGRPMMPFGVMGGAYQSTGHARFVSNLTDFGLDPQAAIDAPRAFADAGVLKVERGYSDAVRAELADRGHHIEVPETPIGGAQSILMGENGTLIGASDPRKDGCALGY